MPNEQQALAEMPIWVLILLAAAGGVSGEMWRADKAGLTGWVLLRRLALHSGASVVCGVAVIFLAMACGAAEPPVPAVPPTTFYFGAKVMNNTVAAGSADNVVRRNVTLGINTEILEIPVAI
ncbi:holin [Pseudomonas aeruginosa]|nr:holin [Pseudomonas aeruginosa]